MATTPAPVQGRPSAAPAMVDPSPMQWGSGDGFTTGVPWIEMGRNATTANVALEDPDVDSLLNWYRRLIALRHANGAIRSGLLDVVAGSNPDVVAWVRRPAAAGGSASSVLVVCNVSDRRQVLSLGAELQRMGQRTGGSSAGRMLHTLASSSEQAGVLDGKGAERGLVSVNNLELPPYGVYVGELPRQAGLESAPSPLRHRRSSGGVRAASSASRGAAASSAARSARTSP
jgi:hypothetical protein